VHLVSSDTTLLAAAPTCGLERVGQTEASVRYSGVGHDCHEGAGEWYPSGLSHVFRNHNNCAACSTLESALDPAETDLVRSMARISISQTMLFLTQGKEIPVLKRALPIFEEILAKKNLYLVPPNVLGQVPAQSQSQDNRLADAYASPHTQGSVVSSPLEQWENNPSFDVDFLGFDFLDEWQIGQLDFNGQY